MMRFNCSLFFVVSLCVCLLFSCDLYVGEVNGLSDQDKSVNDSVDFYITKSEIPEFSREIQLENLKKAEHFILLFDRDSLKEARLNDVRKSYFSINELEGYKKVTIEMLELAKINGDSIQLASSYFNLGYYFFRKEKMDSAYNNYYISERLYTRIGEYYESAKASLSMAILQKNVKDYAGSEASTIRALSYFESTNDLRYMASANNNLGLIANELEKYDEAIKYHNNALAYRRKVKGKKLEIGSLNNIGLAYRNKGEYDRAKKYFKEALLYKEELKSLPKTKARILDNLAKTRFLSGETEEFPFLYMEPLRIRDSIKDNSGAVISNLHLAEYYLKNEAFGTANNYAKIALDKSKPLNYNRGVLEALKLLTKTSSDREALIYANSYIRVSDSLQRKDRAYQDQFARIRFETETIEIENTKVTRQNEKLIIVLLVLVAAFLLVYTFIQRKLSLKELRYRQSQQEASEELYNLMLSQQAKLEEAKQLEKQRISEELHDGVLGRLFGTRLSLDSLNHKIGEEVIEARSKYISELQNIENEIRQISHDLNSAIFTPDVLFTEVVEQLIENQNALNEINSLKCQFIDDYFINWDEVQNNVKIHLYRIIQEALQNINKHAKAKNVLISFAKERNDVLLKIEDDGIGMAIEKVKKGIGLKNIKSRVKQMKGTLRVESKKGKGTTIYVNVTP